MKASLKAIKHTWWALIVASMLLATHGALCLQDAPVRRAVAELERFRQAFDPGMVSEVLTEAARAPGRRPLELVTKALQGPGLPTMVPAPAAPPIEPLGEVTLRTLADAHAYTVPRTHTIGTVDPGPLAHSLAFHLQAQLAAPRPAAKGEDSNTAGDTKGAPDAEQDFTERLLLRSITLRPSTNAVAETELALTAEQLRRKQLVTLQHQAKADAQYERWVERYKNLRKWGASPKVLQRVRERRQEAWQARAAAHNTHDDAYKAYQAAATDALAVVPSPQPFTQDLPIPRVAVATVTLEQAPPSLAKGVHPRPAPGETWQLDLLTPLHPQSVILPPLTGVQLEATREAGLWNAVSQLQAKESVAAARTHYSPFSRHVEWHGLLLGLPLLLQLGPLLLIWFLYRIIVRSHEPANGYNPFATGTVELPVIGFSSNLLNFVTLSLLPAAACALCTAALWGLEQWPVLAAPATLVCLGLGIWAHQSAGEAQELTDAIRRSTRPPPPPAADAPPL